MTEDNGEGKAKTESRKTLYVHYYRLKTQIGDSSVATLPVFSAPSSEDEWVPLELCFGMPLFSSELNRKVCRKIASHKLCSSER